MVLAHPLQLNTVAGKLHKGMHKVIHVSKLFLLKVVQIFCHICIQNFADSLAIHVSKILPKALVAHAIEFWQYTE